MADISKIDPNGLYLVEDTKTGQVVYRTTWKNRRRANSYADKRNLEYGAHRFNPRTAFESEIEPQTAPRKKAMATPLQKQLSPSEQRFFADVLNNWADAEDLADAGLSLSDDGRTLYMADEDEAFKYIDNVYRTEFHPTHNYHQTLRPDKGLAPVPKSFFDPDSFLRSSGPGKSRIGDLFRQHAERSAEVTRVRREIEAGGGPNWLLQDLEDAEGALSRVENELRTAKRLHNERQSSAFQALEERYSSAVVEPYIEKDVFERELDWQSKEAGVRRGESAAGGRAARAARPSLDDLLQDEGIPRESFIDFVETPENRRSGKSVPQLIQDYKIAGELPESAGVPRGRSSAAYPLEGLSSDPILQSGTYTDEFGETVRRPTSLTVSPTSDQRALSALDPESGLNIFTPTEVEAQWEGRPLSDDDLLMRGIDPQSPTGPQDEFNLMYGGDEGFDVEKGFKFEDESPPRSIKEITEDPRYFERFNEDPRYSLNRSGVVSQRLAVIDEQISGLSTNPDNIAILDNALPGDPEAGKLMRKLDELSKERDYLRSWKQQTDESSLARGMAPELLEGATLGMDPETGDFRPVTSSGERQMIVGGSNIPERQMVVPGQNMATPLQKELNQLERLFFSELVESAEDAQKFSDAGLSLSSDGKFLTISDRDRARQYIDDIFLAERKPLGPGGAAQYSSPEEFLSSRRKHNPPATMIDPDDFLSENVSPRRPSSGGTEATQGVMRGGAAMEPQSTRVLTDRALTNLGPAELEQQLRTPQAKTQLKQKNTVNAERLLQLLKDPDIETKVTPGQHGKLRVAAAKLAPVLEALGNAALAAELAYFVGRERDLGKGLMAMGASNVEGTGALMQLPQAGVEAARSAFVPEELQDLPLPGEIATQGLAAAGRGLQSSVGAYRREEDRGDRRVHYERQKAFYRELEPTLSEDQIREMAMRDVSGASTQEAIDDLQRRVSDRDVMMDGFPAQSGMIAEGMRR